MFIFKWWRFSVEGSNYVYKFLITLKASGKAEGKFSSHVMIHTWHDLSCASFYLDNTYETFFMVLMMRILSQRECERALNGINELVFSIKRLSQRAEGAQQKREDCLHSLLSFFLLPIVGASKVHRWEMETRLLNYKKSFDTESLKFKKVLSVEIKLDFESPKENFRSFHFRLFFHTSTKKRKKIRFTLAR